MQNTMERKQQAELKKKSRVRFERLMCHIGYGVCVLIVWGAVLCGGRLLLDIIL